MGILTKLYSKMDLEDLIVFMRFIAGLIYGFVAYVIYRLSLKLLYDVSFTIWFLAGVIYAITVYYVEVKFGYRGFFLTVLRGFLTYNLTWIIVSLVLYDLLG